MADKPWYDTTVNKVSSGINWMGSNKVKPKENAYEILGHTPTSKEITGNVITKTISGDIEKRTGTAAWRNNNPGNIEYGEYAILKGAIGSDGRFAIFPSSEVGQKARSDLIFTGKRYKDLTLSEAITKYAPKKDNGNFENDTERYIKEVSVGLENKKMSEFNEAEKSLILDRMAKHEGYKPGIINDVPEEEYYRTKQLSDIYQKEYPSKNIPIINPPQDIKQNQKKPLTIINNHHSNIVIPKDNIKSNIVNNNKESDPLYLMMISGQDIE